MGTTLSRHSGFTAISKIDRGTYDGLVSSGEETFERLFMSSSGSPTSTSGRLILGYFTARKTETTANVRVISGNVAAAATPTLCRIGLYTEAANGDLALVASTANDTALFASTFTPYVRAWTASYAKVMGQRYALGILVVSGAAMPALYGNGGVSSSEAAIAPRLCGMVTGQADLPVSVLAASVAANNACPYGVVLP